jgi:hypothetical protein
LLCFSKFLSGEGRDEAWGFDVVPGGDSREILFVSGLTACPDFPTTPNAVDQYPGGPIDAFVTQIGVEAYIELFIRGDASADSAVDIGDVISILQHLFSGGSLPCLDVANVSDGGLVNIADPWLQSMVEIQESKYLSLGDLSYSTEERAVLRLLVFLPVLSDLFSIE